MKDCRNMIMGMRFSDVVRKLARGTKHDWPKTIWILIFLMAAIATPLNSRSQSLNALINSAEDFLRKQQYVDALDHLNFAIQKEPGSYMLYFLRGYAKYSLDDYIGAEEDYNKAISFNPFHAEVFVNRAVVRSERLDYSGAFQDLASAEKLDSTNTDIYFNLARIKLILKRYYASIGDCLSAIRLGYRYENIYLVKSAAEWGLKRGDDALADLHKAIEINPSNVYAYVQTGSILLDQGKVDSAIVFFDKALKIDSNNVYALFNRSLARVKIPDQDGAMEDLNNVIRLSPYNSYAYFNRAILFIDKKDRPNAIRNLTDVIHLNPNNIVSYYYRGMLEMEMKKYEDALDDMNKTIELSPDYTDAYYARFQIKTKLKDTRGAKEDYEKAIELGKKNNYNPDSLSTEKKNYLESLVKLSGDFEEMNSTTTKFQNQPVSIQLMPMFRSYFDKASYSLLRYYDSYSREHYHTNIHGFTTHDELFTDTLCRRGIRKSRMNDTVPDKTDPYLKRASYYAALNLFNEAFAQLDSAYHIDSLDVLTFFIRANTRYSLIRLMHSMDTTGNSVTISKSSTEAKPALNDYDPAYDTVIADYSNAIRLDTGFAFAYYNRGIVYGRTGRFKEAEQDFSGAIDRLKDFAEAYYNRGLVSILLKENITGCEDLSRAGELGVADAYRVIKRTCYK